jgi:putative membrane protein insertion efficiency factor
VASRIVHRTFAALPLQAIDISQSVAQLLAMTGSMSWNRAFGAQDHSKLPMKHSSSQHCVDCANAAARLPRNAGRALIWIYRHTLSPLVGYNCRHLPTCSIYGDEAIERFGLWGGGWMTLARLLRCQPWGTSGIDNVPLTTPPGARWYLPWRYGRWRGVNAP